MTGGSRESATTADGTSLKTELATKHGDSSVQPTRKALGSEDRNPGSQGDLREAC